MHSFRYDCSGYLVRGTLFRFHLIGFCSDYFRKSISSITTMFLWRRYHPNCLRGQLRSSSSCHCSSGERSCIYSKVTFLNFYDINIRYKYLLRFTQLLLHQESDNSAQLSQVCDSGFSINYSLKLVSSNHWYHNALLFPDWYWATVSSLSRGRNDKENSKFHPCCFSLVFSFWISPFWLCYLFFRKRGDTRERSSVQSVISLDIRLEGPYHQTLTATMLM